MQCNVMLGIIELHLWQLFDWLIGVWNAAASPRIASATQHGQRELSTAQS